MRETALLKMRSVGGLRILLPLLDRPGHIDRDRERLFALCHWGYRHRRRHLGAEQRARRTPPGNAERRAQRDAGGFGVDLGLVTGIGERLMSSVVLEARGLRVEGDDAAEMVGAGGDQRSE